VIKIVDSTEENLNEMVSFYRNYFAPKDEICSKDYLTWLYLDNPYGKAKLFLFYEEGELVGSTALIPSKLNHNSENVYYAANVLVLPRAKNKLIFFLTIKSILKFLKENDAILIGHPNGKALPFWKKMKVNFFPTKKLSFLSKFSFFDTSIKVKQIFNVGELLDFKCSDKIGLPLNAKFYSWKFFNRNGCDYKKYILQDRNNNTIGFYITKKIFGPITLIVDYQFITTNENYLKYISFGTLIYSSNFEDEVSTQIPFGNKTLVCFISKKLPFSETNILLSSSDY
jgi:hypothetical protein